MFLTVFFFISRLATTTWTTLPRCLCNSWWTSASRWSATRRRSWGASTPWELKFPSTFQKDFSSNSSFHFLVFLLQDNFWCKCAKKKLLFWWRKKVFCYEKRFTKVQTYVTNHKKKRHFYIEKQLCTKTYHFIIIVIFELWNKLDSNHLCSASRQFCEVALLGYNIFFK